MGLAKPITGTPLDPAHPLTPTLVAAFVPQAASRFVDPLGVLWTTVNVPTRASGRTGAAVAYNGVDQAHTNDTLLLPTAGCTVALLLRVGASSETGSAFGTRDETSPDVDCRLQAHLPYAGTIYWDFGGSSGNNRLAWTPAAGYFNAWHSLVFRGGPSGLSIWTDGGLVAAQSNPVSRVNRAAGFSVGAWVSVGNFLTNAVAVEVLFLADREWSDREIGAWTADPYAMFLLRKSPSRFFVPPAGPGPFPSFVDDAMTGGFTSLAGF